MKIGIAAENRPAEKRVILRPQELSGIAAKHEVLVEKNAGIGIGIGNDEYVKAGARIADKKDVCACDLVVRIKAPVEDELKLMRPGSVMMSMMHLRAVPTLVELLKKYRVNAVPLEKLKDEFGRRRVEALHETGYLGMEKAFELWGGDPEKAVVKVMGYGNVACGAIQCAARKLARVTVLNKKDIHEMEKHIPGTDILVNGLKWPHEVRGKVILVRKEMLKLFKKGSVILDLVANPAGQSPIETCRPTSLDRISYAVDGVIHTCCWGWPGLDPVNVSKKYSIQVAPIIRELAERGLDNVPDYIKEAMVRFDGK